MPENITVLIAMVIVLVVTCGIIGYWTLSSRRPMRRAERERAGSETPLGKG